MGRGPQGKEEGTQPSQQLDFRTSGLLNCGMYIVLLEDMKFVVIYAACIRKPNQGGTGEAGLRNHNRGGPISFRRHSACLSTNYPFP